mgnify:CR=1 FL=1
MLDYADFYRIADYANVHWKGGFAPIEIAENAYNYLCEFQSSKEKGEPNDTIKYLLTNLDEDIANGEDLEDVRYWTTEIRKELELNQIEPQPTTYKNGKLYVKDGMARLSECLPKDDQVTIEIVQSDCEM